MTEGFAGFPAEGLEFLAQLAENNEREWFKANKKTYDEALLDPAKRFVEAMGARLAEFAPEVRAEPRVNGSIFRINRDTRFSKDKTPYKTHLDLWFWSGEERGWESSGFFFRMKPDHLILGAGIHQMKKLLGPYREAVADDKTGRALDEALKKVNKVKGATVGGLHYKKVPRGYDAEHPRAELLRHAGLWAEVGIDLPKAVHTKKFVDFCARRFEGVAPVHHWLVRSVSGG